MTKVIKTQAFTERTSELELTKGLVESIARFNGGMTVEEVSLALMRGETVHTEMNYYKLAGVK